LRRSASKEQDVVDKGRTVGTSVTMYRCKDALITSKPKLELCSHLDAKSILPLVRHVSKSLYYVGFPSSVSLSLTDVVRTRLQTFISCSAPQAE
jgi:hypothetical protein